MKRRLLNLAILVAVIFAMGSPLLAQERIPGRPMRQSVWKELFAMMGRAVYRRCGCFASLVNKKPLQSRLAFRRAFHELA